MRAWWKRYGSYALALIMLTFAAAAAFADDYARATFDLLLAYALVAGKRLDAIEDKVDRLAAEAKRPRW